MSGSNLIDNTHTPRMETVTFATPEVGNPVSRQVNVKRSDSTKVREDGATHDGPNAADMAKDSVSSKSRKRTKTGCLTCRKRRIKCGEERPTCANCVKSKRNCEGYTPRVIFKDPVHAYHPPVGAASGHGNSYSTIPTQGASTGHFVRVSLGSSNPAVLAPIAPRPSPPIPQSGAGTAQPLDAQGTHNQQLGLFGYTFDGETFGESDMPPKIPRDQMQPPSLYEKGPPVSRTRSMPWNTFEAMQHPKFHHVSTGDSDSGIDMGCPGSSSEWSHSSTSSAGLPLTNPTIDQVAGISPTIDDQAAPRGGTALPQALFPPRSDQQFPECWLNTTPESYQKSQLTSPGMQCRQQQCTAVTPEIQANSAITPTWQSFQGTAQATATMPQHTQSGNTSYQQSPPVEEPEDDYWDISSDDGMAASVGCSSDAAPADLGLMIAISAKQHGKSFRSLTNFLHEPNVLASYRPTYAASPLRDPQTALVFCHFITATAPTISSSERRIVNSAAMFSGVPVPKSQQALWTYTMPMLALHDQGLLHALLALSSLHIAKLQKTSPTPSLKHYHFALRKVAKSLGGSTKRNTIATLGATLLLGFYEVTTAEHNKWNSHLAGAKQLVMSLDYEGTARRVKAQKARIAESRKQSFNAHFSNFTHAHLQSYTQPYQYYDDLDNHDKLDDNLISILMGWQTNHDRYGQVFDDDDFSTPPSAKPLTEQEIDDFDTQVDLFWWYAKQDMYQSIISGNRLLLPYERWNHIPPRSPVGRLDGVCGTMDHLLLLMARIAEFAARDSPRKKAVFAKQCQQMQSPTTVAPSTSYLPPPPDGEYTPIATNTPIVDDDLHTSTLTAQAEWLAITRALDTFEEALGLSFAPLSAEHMPPLSTPFGPAIYYRTYSIACIWSLFYTGRIIAARVHPSMPPAAMAAAGIAAPRTAVWANTIGRVNAGIQPLNGNVPLNPLHGAALMDSCMGTFHAGVQFRDAAQRGWTITKLKDVARLTGWQTSALIASGCERAWMRMAEEGKGPPYERTMNKTAKDDRVAGRSRDYQGPPKDNNDRRFVHINPGTRVYWAMGILSVDEDMKGLDLGA